MNTNNLKSLLSLSCEERYDYSLSTIIEEKEMWILVNNNNEFLKIYAEEEGFEYLPIWPSPEIAELYAEKSKDLSAKSISLPEFFKKWVTGLKRDKLEIGVFPGADHSVWLTEAEEFKCDIQDELSTL